MRRQFGWLDIIRLGFAQTALGAIVVMTTSTLNRVMVVELALPALVPGLLVALHHLVQMLRPRWGYGSDRGGRRTPWIIGGMAVLATGGVLASVATALMADHGVLGFTLAILAFLLIGVGVGACGTTLLVLLAQNVGEGRRAGAATIVWVMMIAGFVVTGGVAGHFLDPFTLQRLVLVTLAVCVVALLVTIAAVWRIEPDGPIAHEAGPGPATFAATLASVWADRDARNFTIFVLVSMLAYSMQDLILEPFAGIVFGMTPGETTKLSGLQNAGTLSGMIGVALATGMFGEASGGLLKRWMVGGCLASAVALASIACAGLVGPSWPIRASVFGLGLANGAFAVAAIGSMMGLAGQGGERSRGTRMGLWGAAQAIGFGFGGLTGTVAADAARTLFASTASAYASVFAVEALIFLACALAASRLTGRGRAPRGVTAPRMTDRLELSRR